MEGVRFTGAEGGARLAGAARARNTLAALAREHAAFVAGKLLQEDAHRIRGALSEGRQRSVYVTREMRVACVAYELNILTDLAVASATRYDAVEDWRDELERKEVLVATSTVVRQLLAERVLSMDLINVLVLDSCHAIHSDPHLQAIMAIHSEQATHDHPRILALTYPLFSQIKKKVKSIDTSETISSPTNEACVEPNDLLSMDDDSDLKENDSCNIPDPEITEISDKVDMLRIDDIIKSNDKTKLIVIKDAIFANKAKIIELDASDDENCVTEAAINTTDKVSDKAGDEKVDKDGLEIVMDESVDRNDVELSKNYVELKLTKSIDDIELELNKDTATVSELVAQIEWNHDNKDLVNETCNISHIKNVSLEICDNMNLKMNALVIEEEFKDMNDDKINVELHNNTLGDKNENEETPQKENKDIISEMFLQNEVQIEDINELTEKLQNVGTNAEDEDFLLYEKLEWKIQELERKLCCTADLAEDIDGIKRLSTTVSEPRELIVQYARRTRESSLPETYVELENYMRATVADILEFIDEHRYDPTEIYGDDAFCEELKGIPDPTLDPKEVFHQFIYVLDELGPYGADKAALSLVAKLEKLKIKIPYERHFLLLCVCMTVFLKIRCVAEHAFQKYEADWEKIQKFSTPKMHRLIEILEQFKPPNDARSPRNSPAHRNSKSENMEANSDNKKTVNEPVVDNTNKTTDDTMANGLNVELNHSNVTSVTKSLDTTKMLDDINKCDFVSIGNKLADRVNTYQANLAEIHDMPPPDDRKSDIEVKSRSNENESTTTNEVKTSADVKGQLMAGPSRRLGPRNRGRGRGGRYGHAARALQMLQNPDALCGIVFMKDPLMAKVLFLIIVDLSRSHPSLGYLCAQYSGEERQADATREPRELERQRRMQEEVLKKFRMHECNLLLATSALEEGIDLPRCNLVLRWDAPASYRSYSLCRSRARAPRSACVLLSDASRDTCSTLVRHVAVYRELDQMLSRKCGCGVQDEPPTSEEEHANLYTKLIKPYSPSVHNHTHHNEKIAMSNTATRNGETAASDKLKQDKSECGKINSMRTGSGDNECDGEVSEKKSDKEAVSDKEVVSDNVVSDSELASVDLSSAISLINRYCGKLPSDTFTRLAPQWWIEEVYLPTPATNLPTDRPTGRATGATVGTNPPTGCATDREERKTQKAYICTLRLPLNCPVKYNIVGHPMPTRVLARRMVALQACRILHRSAELDNQLMPIGKENFRAPELEYAPAPPGDAAAERPSSAELAELARPGTTKRRQYYFKRTAWSFTDCQPVQDASDSEVEQPGDTTTTTTTTKATEDKKCDPEDGIEDGGKRNMLYAIVSRLCCALPERYNTRGRRLHVPQTARQGLGILTGREIKKIPAFPVYTRSGEVRVSVERIADADVRVSPRRARLVRRFMKFVFAEVLRVRRRGMRLSTDGRYNNYYVVPTCRSTRDDGTDKIDVDWEFLELIYRHTEKRGTELEHPVWNPDDEESRTTRAGVEGNGGGKRADDDAIASGEKEKEDGKRVILESIKESQDGNIVPEEEKTTSEDGNEEVQKEKTVSADGTKEKELEEGNVTPDKVKKDSLEGNKGGQDGKKDLQEKDVPQEDVKQDGKKESENGKKDTEEGPLKKELQNPLLAAGDKFAFDAERYKEAVVTPWYRNQDQPQFFLVAEICWKLSPESAFPSATHTTFRHYYTRKYGVRLTQAEQPLLDVDHTSARLNLLTPRYVNRKGVALPVSSERTRRDKRDRLDQKQILVPELCRVHPFAAPLWFATVALPCVLYRINALLIADEIRRSVAIDVGLGSADLNEHTRPGFEWPPLDFGWSLAEVLSVDEAKAELERREGGAEKEREASEVEEPPAAVREKTLNEILQEKEDAESGFEIGMWSNDMASSVPDDYDEMMEPLPPNLTFCTSASGGSNWPDSVERPTYPPPPRPSAARAFSMADSDCSYMSSDLDTDDSSLDTDGSDDDTSGFGSHQHTSARLGVRIEYKTPHEAEAFELKTEKKTTSAPQPDEADDVRDRIEADAALRDGPAPDEHIQKFRHSVDEHRKEILEKRLLINDDEPITTVLPPIGKDMTNQFNAYGIAAKSVKMTATDCLKDTHNIPEHLPHLNVKNANHNTFTNTTDSTSEKSGTSFNNSTDLTSESIVTSFNHTEDLTAEIGCDTFRNKADLTSEISGTSFNETDPTSDMLVLKHSCKEKSSTDLFKELFPFGTICETDITKNGQISIEAIEKSKRILLERLKASLTDEEIKKKNCFSMVDVDIDSPNYINEKVANVGFDDTQTYINKLKSTPLREETEKEPYVDGVKDESGKKKAEFDFDYQPKLEGHPGPSPSVILQALTMSNANDGINLERLETIGDSFLKFAITAYLYCAQPTVHEGKLSHMRSKQVSNLNLYRLGRGRRLGARMIASKFEPHDNWLPPCHRAPATMPGPRGHSALHDAAYWQDTQPQEEHEPGCSAAAPGGRGARAADCRCGQREREGCFIPYNLITQHSIPDKSVADCVEALIGAYLIECGPRGALLFMSWLGIKVLPRYEVPLDDRPELGAMENKLKEQRASDPLPRPGSALSSSSSSCSSLAEGAEGAEGARDAEDAPADAGEDSSEPLDWSWEARRVGTLRPYRDRDGRWLQPVFGELKAPPSPLLRYIDNPDGELEQMLSGYEALERTLGYRFRDRSLLLQALTHASHHLNRLTDCYQRLEFLGDAILDYLITRHLYEDERRHSPGALTDLRSALVNNTIFATLAVRHGFHKYFRHMSPGLNEVLTRYVKIQEENGHSISEEHYLIQEDEMEQAEDVEVPKALGDLFESVAGAIFLDSGMSLGAVWRSYVGLMGAELEAFSAAAPKSPVRELLEAEPDTAKFGKPERLADGRRVRVCVEVFGRGTFKGVGRNYRIAKGTAARCALRHLKRAYRNDCTA